MTAARGPRRAASAVTSTLTALVARLREAEIQPTAQELADALWLAQFAGPLARPRPQVSEAVPPVAGGLGVKPPDPAEGAGPAPAEHLLDQGVPGGPTASPGYGDKTDLFTPGPGTGPGRDAEDAHPRAWSDGVRVAAPAAATLPEPLALQRALRPLQHYRPPARTTGRHLDEQATADRAAETGLILPVLRPDRRRQARLALVMDVSSSTVVWEQTLDELRQVCERAGAFREVRTHFLHEGEDGEPRVGGGVADQDHLVDPSQLWDPGGRRLTLLLSDCAGPMWRSGRLQRLLYGWARTAPLAVVQPLPQRMWRSTHLPTRQGVLRRREGPAGRLEFQPRRPERGRDARGLPVPVLALRQSSFGAWARLVSGSAEQTMEAAVGRVRADHAPAAGSARAEQDLTPAERVAAFCATASPDAAQLAACLSAAPLVLPVMQLVQRAMLVDSGPEVLAEVLLSGLLRTDEEESGPGLPGYAFLDGVREELLELLGAGSAILVLKHCSEYVERRYGRTVRNFPALAAAVLAGSVDPGGSAPAGPADDSRLRVFARVSAQVLRRFGRPDQFVQPGGGGAGPRELSDRARDCLDRFRSYGTVRDLDMGVQLLGAAVRAEKRVAERAFLYGELAQALLLRWELRRLGEDLGEALSAVENALPHERRAHLTLARVLEAMADEAESGRAGADEAWWLRALTEPQGPPGRPGETWRLPVAPDASAAVPETGTEPRRQEARSPHEVALYLLNRAHSSLALISGIPPASAAQRADWRAASLARVRVLRRLAELEPAWAGGCLDNAVQVTDALLTEARTGDVLLLRGALLLALARRAAAGGGEEPALTARAYAERAATDLYAGFETLAPGSVGDAEVSRAWLDVADAVELSRTESDDSARLTVLQALDQARRYAGPDREARTVCLLRMAKVLRERYESTRSRTHLDSAVVAWSEALELMGPDDPRRPAAFTELGDALTARARAKDSVEDARGAVRALRRALDETSESDPELARRRYLLGAAHVRRFHTEEVLSDLHEAHWILGAAARATDRSTVLARIWLLRAEVLRLLSERTGSPARLGEAADHALRAAQESRTAGEPLTEAAARQARALLLERTAGPARAREEHHEALRVLSAAPASAARDEAEALSRAETDRLDGEPGAS
ncbi:SAV_2336 N-terminal domain-related protein [Streptomyces sp. NPDC051597]|uniref:SAV_2336 N-terminal domain-related protein n=1 Tax=Streptomyces sp. NPDC051597 TaxID=3155049 RepID=UPI00343DF969